MSRASRKKFSLSWILLLTFLLVGCGKKSSEPSSSQPVSAWIEIEPRVVDGKLVFRPETALAQAQPAIVRPQVSSFEQADDRLHNDELVLGVHVDGESRAYPINMLNGPSREIINDDLGGVEIAATW